MDERRTQPLRIGLIALTALIGVGIVFASLLVGTTPFTTIGTALAVIVLMSSTARLAGEGSALGKRHIWLFASIPIGMLLQVVVFLTLWRILGLDRTTAFYAALPVALLVATIVGLYGVRETV